eukprot:TRINITY_DN5575_c0_g1_i4.p1 TRINITY_DN5575_c0_g1~~TRINITY_DN5575_c0_g1_i4.p1  ORF type:complete len:325 (+),score=68.99 TRINITY_DN5575_c0_g1_i4:46-1020(+)
MQRSYSIQPGVQFVGTPSTPAAGQYQYRMSGSFAPVQIPPMTRSVSSRPMSQQFAATPLHSPHDMYSPRVVSHAHPIQASHQASGFNTTHQGSPMGRVVMTSSMPVGTPRHSVDGNGTISTPRIYTSDHVATPYAQTSSLPTSHPNPSSVVGNPNIPSASRPSPHYNASNASNAPNNTHPSSVPPQATAPSNSSPATTATTTTAATVTNHKSESNSHHDSHNDAKPPSTPRKSAPSSSNPSTPRSSAYSRHSARHHHRETAEQHRQHAELSSRAREEIVHDLLQRSAEFRAKDERRREEDSALLSRVHETHAAQWSAEARKSTN